MNIIEKVIVPYNPSNNKVINYSLYSLYAPAAGNGKVGMAGYNPDEFDVSCDQIVSLTINFKAGIVHCINLLETVPVGAEVLTMAYVSTAVPEVASDEKDI